jgi:hypothetical protein
VVDGRFTGRLDGLLCHDVEKARRVSELAAARDIDLSRSFAYTDSIEDLAMLELVGNPVAMNPDRSLAAEARRRGWQVLDYRTARRRTLVGSAAGATAAAVAAAGYAAGYAVGRSRGMQAAGSRGAK